MSCKLTNRQAKRAAMVLTHASASPEQLFNLRQHIERLWDQCPKCQGSGHGYGRRVVRRCDTCQGIGALYVPSPPQKGGQ